MTPGVELIVVMLVFLGLLTVGMTIPFAILVPSVLYHVMHAGLAGLKGIGLVSWGSMNSFTLTAIPLFILMAEILQESKLSQRVYRGLSTLVSWMPRVLLQTNIAGCAIFATSCGEFNARVLMAALGTSVRVCGNILFIVYAAFGFSYAISYAGVGEQIT